MSVIRPSVERLEDSPIIDVWRSGIGLPDIIGLWAGEPDLPTPDFICRAASEAMFAGHTFYSANRGIPELRQALVEYLHRVYGVSLPETRIAATASGMNAVVLAAQATLSPGDNAVVVTPSWPNVMRAVQIANGEVRQVPLTPGGNGWFLDLDRVAASCDARTRLIYVASPANPTGWMMTREEGESLLAIARRTGAAILADEVYHRIVYDRPAAFSMLEISAPDDPVLVVNSFSKAWAMTGWRLGWIVYPDGAMPAFEKLIQFNTSGTPAFLQYGAIAALRDGEPFIKSFVERCRVGREVVGQRLAAMNRVRAIPNVGSFYAMFEVEGVTDTLGFCMNAVRKAGIGMAPGSAFGLGAERMIRLCYAKGKDTLHQAMDRLDSFIATT